MAHKYIQATHHLIPLLRQLTATQVSSLHSLQVGLSHLQQQLEQDNIHLLTMGKQEDIHSNLQLKEATREGSTLLQGPSNHQHPTTSHLTISSMASPVTQIMPTTRTGAILRQGMGAITRVGETTITTRLEPVSVHVCAQCFINISLR
jgi:ATP-dependent Clp protease ATP-binding subunit ClpA